MSRFSQSSVGRLTCLLAVLVLLLQAGCLAPAPGSSALTPPSSTTTMVSDSTIVVTPPVVQDVTDGGQVNVSASPAVAETDHHPASDHEPTIPVAQADGSGVADGSSAGGSLDWPYWRGPHYNGKSLETGLPDDFDPVKGTNVGWKRDDLGTRSTPIAMNGRLYVLARSERGTKKEGERVVCLDAATGKTVWENRFNVWLSDVPDTRVAWSSVVGDPETGDVYALGVCGYFQCIDGETGKTKWSYPLHEQFGLLSTYGGRTNFPVICDDLVIISAIVIGWGDMAEPAHRFLGFDKRTGEVRWFSGTRLLPYDTTYSSPTVTVLAGQKALVFGSGDGDVWAMQPRTGRGIWNYHFSRRGLNVPPLVDGDMVYASHSEENIGTTAMGAIAAIDGSGQGDVTKTGEKWKVEEMMVGKSAPLMVDGRLYVVDDRAKMYVYDPKTGEQIGRRQSLGTAMRSSPLYADGKIYAMTVNRRWYILEPDGDRGVKVVSKGRFPAGAECHGSPIVSHGRVYVPTTSTLYCLHDAGKEQGVQPSPEMVTETAVSADEKPDWVQVVPAEALLKPGSMQRFRVRLFNARGQFLKESEAEFKVKGPGQIGADGMFLASSDAGHTDAYVTAKVGDLEGRARVRIVPALPWKFDFEGLDDCPVTFVGCRYRHVLREIDGNTVMVKISTIPKGTRSRCWFGHPGLHDYTIEADVMGARTDNQMPDIGLIAQGYTLDLQGAAQKLQIRTWGTQLRMASTVDFPWEPDKWYRMKHRAEVRDGKAYLKGKVWPKGEPEPDAWTIEAVDESPNVTGSPGLWGSAKAAELFLDNIEVYDNKP